MSRINMILALLIIILALPSYAQFNLRDPAFLATVKGPITAAGETLLLDEIGTSASLAYSVARKLRAAYSGDCITVYRVSDGTEEAIGFSGNVIDTNELATFCSGTWCYLVRIHDQGSIDADLVQSLTNNAPFVVTNGVLCIGSNGRLMAIFETGGNDEMASASAAITLPMTHMIVFNHDTFNANRVVFDGGSASQTRMRQTSTSSSSSAMRLDNGGTGQNSATSLSADTWYLNTTTWLGSTGAETIRVNDGSEEINTDVGDNNFSLYRFSFASMRIHETVIWAADLSSGDETLLRDNINAFYSIW